MSRIIKNVVIIAIILGVCVLSFFTMKGAAKSNIPNNVAFEKDFGGTIPQFNNGEFSEENRPQIPSGNFEKEDIPNKGELPESFEKGEMPNMGELPENFENGKIPEDFNNGNLSGREFKQNISAIYYILFAIEGLIISLLLIYLIMSGFNSKTFKATLGTGIQKIVFVILVLIITVGLTVLQSMLAKNVFAGNNRIQFEDRQNFRNNINNINIVNQSENNKI